MSTYTCNKHWSLQVSAVDYEICMHINWFLVYSDKTHLISICMTAYDDGFLPRRNEAGDVRANDSFTEYSATQDVPDCSIWAFPHFLQLEF